MENEAAVRAFVSPYLILWPTDEVVDHYVSIRCDLESTGQTISEADLWIAATARAYGDTVVTNNVNEFKRVRGLIVEDWSV